ncbi:TPA: hypothetical protein RI785_002328 [Vibrio cholerae]|uniref:Uncharacterized protein n=1 Tax=Vibrio cholerae TaxID=666 RepID=A0A5Q6PDA0_VIBCL|nr:hypothetical protein [Vibrio cholerae]KAA1252816.1 hypothetical protein F0M16_21015 [Vibrio cholerae]HDV5593610.1 hypothetical protein [Vibrio cholerae]
MPVNNESIPLLEGDVFRTVSGRITTPFPRTNYKSEKRNSRNINEWLKNNAINEAKATNNEYMTTILSGLNVDNWSPADSSQVNLFLFNDSEGRIGNLKVV